MGSMFVLLTVSKEFITNVLLAIAVLELAAFFQCHRTTPYPNGSVHLAASERHPSQICTFGGLGATVGSPLCYFG